MYVFIATCSSHRSMRLGQKPASAKMSSPKVLVPGKPFILLEVDGTDKNDRCLE